MKIDRVTITGADSFVDPLDLLELYHTYPFVEFGILFSNTKKGEKRYPTNAWIDTICYQGLNLSAHLCGQLAKDIINSDNFEFLDTVKQSFKRVQINFRFDTMVKYNFEPLFDYAFKNLDLSIILQYNHNNAWVLNQLIHHAECPHNIQFLYDDSGGLGKVISKIEDPLEGHYTGYAGGINGDNVTDICKKITEHPTACNAWIDLETGVRNGNDEFSMSIADLILYSASSFISPIKK